MPRKRPTPWIHRWSRLIMAGLATIGAAVTAYLTYSKLTGNEAAAPQKAVILFFPALMQRYLAYRWRSLASLLTPAWLSWRSPLCWSILLKEKNSEMV